MSPRKLLIEFNNKQRKLVKWIPISSLIFVNPIVVTTKQEKPDRLNKPNRLKRRERPNNQEKPDRPDRPDRPKK